MDRGILFFITSFAVSFVLFPATIKVLRKYNLLDSPGGRKIHTEQTPSIGGVPIFLGIMLSVVMWLPLAYIGEFKYVISALIISFILGLRDDLIDLKANQKLIGQIAAASLLIFFCDIRLRSMYGLFGIYDIPIWASFLLTTFTFIVVTNAFNLIDGIDGLAASLSIIALLFFGGWFMLVGKIHFSFFCFAFAGALLAFLNYNWYPSKIFMGDTGSLLIGFFLAASTIYFIDSNYKLAPESLFKFNAFIATGVGMVIIPLYDTLRVFCKRVMEGKSPMIPDKNHVHHVLLKLGLNHAWATIVLIAVQSLFVALIIFGKDLTDVVMLPTVILMAVGLGSLLDFLYHRKVKDKRNDLSEEMKEEGKQVFLKKSA